MKNQNTPHNKPKKLGLGELLLSTLAAAFGVQTKKNHERDFQQGKIGHYIAAGIIFTLIFIFAIIALVKLALSQL